MKSNSAWVIFGTFDVDNYGDLLFPIVAAWRLSENVIACSPTRNAPNFPRDPKVFYLSVADVVELRPRAVLIGGGNILHFRRSKINPYKGRWFSYASLQLVPFLFRKYKGVPIFYNAPSVPCVESVSFWRFFFAFCFNNAEYLSFRDCESVNFARSISKKRVDLIPDTAFDISRVWPPIELMSPLSENYVVVHVNERYGGTAEQVARSLDEMADQLVSLIIFLPIGLCHGDMEYAEEVTSLMTNEVRMVKETDVHLFARYIANAEMYLGSSMHGFITALSYGVKASLVLNSKPMSKFEGVLLEAGFSADYFFSSWSQVPSRLSEVRTIDSALLARIHEKLDAHWDDMRDSVEIVQRDNGLGSMDLISVGFKLNLLVLKITVFVFQFIDKLFSRALRFLK